MREKTNQLIAKAGLVGAANGANNDCNDGEKDVDEMKSTRVVPEDDFEATEEGSAEAGVAFLEFRREGTGGFERGRLATEPAGEKKYREKGDCVICISGYKMSTA